MLDKNNSEEEKNAIELSDFEFMERSNRAASLIKTFNKAMELTSVEDIPLSKISFIFLIP